MAIFKVVKNTMYFGIIPKLSTLIGVIILPMITPFLSTYDYGIQGVVTSYTGIMICIAPLGLNLYLTNSFFEMPQKYPVLWGRVFYLFLLSGIFFGVISTIILIAVLPITNIYTLLAISIIGSLQIVFFASGTLATHLYPLLENPKPLVITNMISALIGLLVLFVMVYSWHLGFWGLVVNTAISSIVSFFAFAYLLNKKNIRPILETNIKRIKKMLKVSLPIVPHTLGFILLTGSARIVMSLFQLSYDDIGLYSHGCTMGDYIVIVSTALVTAITPQMQRSYRNGEYNKYRDLYFLCQGVALLSSFLVCIWMHEIYSVLIRNAELQQSASIATYMCFAQVQLPLYWFMSQSCFIERKTKQLLFLVFIPGIINLTLCFILIPILGYKAGMYITMFSYWSQILIPFVIPYFNDKISLWLGRKYMLLLLLFLILTLLLLGNMVSISEIYIKIIVTLFSLCLFLYIVKRKKLYNVI